MNASAGNLGVHDAGGSLDFGARDSLAGALERSKEAFAQWEIEVCSLAVIMTKKGYRVVDESRRTLELLPPERYGTLSYWAKWACGTAQLALAANLFTQSELDEALGSAAATDDSALGAVRPDAPRFCGGETVRVRSEKDHVRWRRPHLRTPGYIHGAEGLVIRVQGPYANPEEVAFFSQGPKRTDAYLYTVRFFQRSLWVHYAGGAEDTLDVDIFEGWLDDPNAAAAARDPNAAAAAARGPNADARAGAAACGAGGGWAGRGSLLVPVPDADGPSGAEPPAKKVRTAHQPAGHGAHAHAHHGGAHTHEPRGDTEQAAVDREAAHAAVADKDGAFAALHGATVELLVLKGAISRDELRRQVEVLDGMAYGQAIEGATLVAKAWVDAGFKALLLADPARAIAQAGLQGVVDARGGVGSTRAGIGALEYMGTETRGAPAQAVAPIGDTALVVVENTPSVHNLVVCTLCSCYPRALLGLPPRYYTSRAYRSRGVSEPRAVLAEFGCALPRSNTTVRVHDSTADTRILVLPQRPAGTHGWDEAALRPLATRDCLVGVALPRVPAPAPPPSPAQMLAAGRASAVAAYAPMAPPTLDAAYDNGLACRPMLGAWKERLLPRSHTERAAAPPELLDLRYGPGADERLDFLPARSSPSAAGAAGASTLLYIHGGYWHMNNPKESNCFVASALRRRGVNVAVVEYSGLPNPEPQPISAQCMQVLSAVEFVSAALAAGRLPGDPARLVVAGHSAGGQLASVCALHPRTRAKLAGAVCISMIADLEPLRRHSYFNLNLPAAGRRLIAPDDVLAWSPLALIPPAEAKEALPPIVAAVGADELPELRHQTRDFHAACTAQGHAATHLEVPNKSHFDVLDGLADGGDDAPLFAQACRLLGV